MSPGACFSVCGVGLVTRIVIQGGLPSLLSRLWAPRMKRGDGLNCGLSPQERGRFNAVTAGGLNPPETSTAPTLVPRPYPPHRPGRNGSGGSCWHRSALSFHSVASFLNLAQPPWRQCEQGVEQSWAALPSCCVTWAGERTFLGSIVYNL